MIENKETKGRNQVGFQDKSAAGDRQGVGGEDVSLKQAMGSFNKRNTSPATHAIHIHMKSDCSSDDGKSAGGHWNPTFKNHGKWGDKNGYHKGDIGNFEVDESGYGKRNFFN